ncbi:hypothetical protein F5148DRAFT_1287439 [Russula earlei]|uniref:Uncharacterized protein n=1 Tax=Russula earlei TaxID=71964 RepID=A0ACC0U389_9AGAM|nr:hypothetical protein F5148DRAFT_1287439 [Russula earlei]
MASQPPVVLHLEDIRLELEPDEDGLVVAAALDLLHTIISDNQVLAAQVLSSLKNSNHVGMKTDGDSMGLVQLMMLILEDALMRSVQQRSRESALITSAMGLLEGLLSLPDHGTMATEHAVGTYVTMQALLHLVHALWTEASGTLLAPHHTMEMLA